MLKFNPKLIDPLKKYASFATIIALNTFFVFPFIKKQYGKIFTNSAEITHIVTIHIKIIILILKVFFRYFC